VFVGGLDFNLTSEELKDHFQKNFGEVQDAIILKDIYTGKSRGFGFVTFKDESVAQKLVNEVTVTEINKRKIDIKKAEPKTPNSYQPIPGKPLMAQEGGQPAMVPSYIPSYGQNDSNQTKRKSRSSSPGREDRYRQEGN